MHAYVGRPLHESSHGQELLCTQHVFTQLQSYALIYSGVAFGRWARGLRYITEASATQCGRCEEIRCSAELIQALVQQP